jgi:hypothetical protein
LNYHILTTTLPQNKCTKNSLSYVSLKFLSSQAPFLGTTTLGLKQRSF